MYDFNNDIWLCHSFGGKCYNITAFVSRILDFEVHNISCEIAVGTAQRKLKTGTEADA